MRRPVIGAMDELLPGQISSLPSREMFVGGMWVVPKGGFFGSCYLSHALPRGVAKKIGELNVLQIHVCPPAFLRYHYPSARRPLAHSMSTKALEASRTALTD